MGVWPAWVPGVGRRCIRRVCLGAGIGYLPGPQMLPGFGVGGFRWLITWLCKKIEQGACRLAFLSLVACEDFTEPSIRKIERS